jgi:hypothetical protein
MFTFIPTDKQLHFFATGYLFAVLTLLMPLPWAAALACGAAILWEVLAYYKITKSVCDPWDAIAGCLGVLPLYIIAEVITPRML